MFVLPFDIRSTFTFANHYVMATWHRVLTTHHPYSIRWNCIWMVLALGRVFSVFSLYFNTWCHLRCCSHLFVHHLLTLQLTYIVIENRYCCTLLIKNGEKNESKKWWGMGYSAKIDGWQDKLLLLGISNSSDQRNKNENENALRISWVCCASIDCCL